MSDIFDRIKLDIFDEVELPVEQRIAFSDEMADLVREELRKEIAKIPLGKLITKVMEREAVKLDRSNSSIKEAISRDLSSTKADLKNEVTTLREEIAEFTKKIKAKYADLKNEILSAPQYQFGGFSPQVNDLNIGDPATNGSWRIVKSGSNLSVQRLESGAWVETFAFTPNI